MHKVMDFRRGLLPLGLIVLCPVGVMCLFYSVFSSDGSVFTLVGYMLSNGFSGVIPVPTFRAVVLIVAYVLFELCLLLLLPGEKFFGPTTSTGYKPEYTANGLKCFVVTICILVGFFLTGVVSPSIIFNELGAVLTVLNALSLLLCFICFFKGKWFPSSGDVTITGKPFYDFFIGTELHPRIFGVDLKILFISRVGMMLWGVYVVVHAAKQYEDIGYLTNAMLVSTSLQLIYVGKFYFWEKGYVAAVDISKDAFGFMMCWGPLVWLPYVHTFPTLYILCHTVEIPTLVAFLVFATGLFLIYVNYVADQQRHWARELGEKAVIFGKPPNVIRAFYKGADGKENSSLLLASGFWGLARHFHYFPDLLNTLSCALPAGFVSLPYLHFVYLSVLLYDRTYRLDKRCHEKYGKYWEEYVRRVPYRMIPLVV